MGLSDLQTYQYVAIVVVVIAAFYLYFRVVRMKKDHEEIESDAKPVDNNLKSVLEHDIERNKEVPLRSVLPLNVYDVNNEVTADPDAYDVVPGKQKCPVCGAIIDDSLEVCPRCHEQIQEIVN